MWVAAFGFGSGLGGVGDVHKEEDNNDDDGTDSDSSETQIGRFTSHRAA